ncbi:MAG: UDP-N-acetylmuramoylalanine--D-glutamate ligase [Actinomycetota bacterium]|jgi:UDP-N-acetylmuramoylalanine--D-glutamate ligase|nr:UDP-N-acetylmuramoylalanine--D-glutamate ligase [Actinomycetota bacterium]
MSLAGKKVLVVGLGASGWAAARALVELGASVHVTESSDSSVMEERAAWLRQRGALVDLGHHDLDHLAADLAVVSPGIPPTADIMRALEHSPTVVISEVELAYRLATCDFLAVTGTNGKTTTTSLLAAMLERSGVESVAAGNIGLPLIDAIGQVGELGAIALEVSSFQLAGIESFRPRVAVLLNIAEDHTDWHGSIDAYAEAKARIVENQTGDDFFVVNADDERAWKVAELATSKVVPFSTITAPTTGIGIEGPTVMWQGTSLMNVAEIRLPGRAGLEDTLAATAAALSYGLDLGDVKHAIDGFVPLHHRLELVTEWDEVAYIDDSKATNPHAALAAVAGLTDVVLIAGGRSKGIDLTSLKGTVPPVIAVVAIGEAQDEVVRVFEDLVPVDRASSMDEAVRAARARSVAGGSVLLAPGCASLDMYESYSERGDDFARSVRDLRGGSV